MAGDGPSDAAFVQAEQGPWGDVLAASQYKTRGIAAEAAEAREDGAPKVSAGVEALRACVKGVTAAMVRAGRGELRAL
eukprot:596649-Lingulodinium_polyedra.AAC.1